MADEKSPNPGDRKEPSPLLLMGAGLELASVVAVFSLLGWWLDQKLGTDPWLLVTLMAVALVGGLYRMWRVGKRFFD